MTSPLSVSGRDRFKFLRRPILSNADHILYYRATGADEVVQEGNKSIYSADAGGSNGDGGGVGHSSKEERRHSASRTTQTVYRRDRAAKKHDSKCIVLVGTKRPPLYSCRRDSEAQTDPCTLPTTGAGSSMASLAAQLSSSAVPALPEASTGARPAALASLDLLRYGRDLPAKSGEQVAAAARVADQGKRAARMLREAEAKEAKTRTRREEEERLRPWRELEKGQFIPSPGEKDDITPKALHKREYSMYLGGKLPPALNDSIS